MRDDCALTAEHITRSFPQMPGKLDSRKKTVSQIEGKVLAYWR